MKPRVNALKCYYQITSFMVRHRRNLPNQNRHLITKACTLPFQAQYRNVDSSQKTIILQPMSLQWHTTLQLPQMWQTWNKFQHPKYTSKFIIMITNLQTSQLTIKNRFSLTLWIRHSKINDRRINWTKHLPLSRVCQEGWPRRQVFYLRLKFGPGSILLLHTNLWKWRTIQHFIQL